MMNLINTINDLNEHLQITDTNFTADCKYFNISEFADILKSKAKSELAIVHFNLRSLIKNKSKVQTFLMQLPTLPEVIAVTETKLNLKSDLLQTDLENYQFAHKDSTSNAGGVGLYVRNDLNFVIKPTMSVESENCESLFIEISSKPSKKKLKNTVVGVVYRHPGNSYSLFQKNFCNVMHMLNQHNTPFVLLGDYNIDLAKENNDFKVNDYLNEVYSTGGYSLITKPTRFTSTSATNLDHIYTNAIQNLCRSGVLILDISDHLPTFCLIKNNCQKNRASDCVRMIRDVKHFNPEFFAEEIALNLQQLIYTDDPDLAIKKFLQIIIDATNKHAPLRKLSRKEMKLKSKPWITKGLLKSISTKNKLFQQCYKQNNPFLGAKYKSYLNTLTKIKEIAKRNYYQNELTTHRGDLAKQWKIINEIICHKKASNEVINVLTDHHKCNITDKVKIANLFNEFFTNVGTSLDSKISRTGIKKCNVPSIVQSFFYEPITSEEVLMQFCQINAFKASGPENVPNKFYKLLAPIISPYLSNLFNACYESGYFPAVLKCAKIIP